MDFLVFLCYKVLLLQPDDNRNHIRRVSPLHLVSFTLNDAVRTITVSDSFENSSKQPGTTAINTGGFTFKREDQRAVSAPLKTTTLELIPFTINDAMSRPTSGSSSPEILNNQKKSFQPTATPQTSPDIVEIPQTSPPVSLVTRPPSFVDSSFIESVSDDPDFHIADPQKGVDFVTTFLDEPNFTNINLVESINLIGSRPVRKAQHPSQFR